MIPYSKFSVTLSRVDPVSILHITSGDCAASILRKSGIPGTVFVWRDILYDGPRNPGWPDEYTLHARAQFLEESTGGGLKKEDILITLRDQYQIIATSKRFNRIVLWFDACLFDQSMLSHILACLRLKNVGNCELLCVDNFPGIARFDGLGQLSPEQISSIYHKRKPVTDDQFDFAIEVDRAFALQDIPMFIRLSHLKDAALPWIPDAVARWLKEQPDKKTGLSRLEQLVLDAIRAGCETPNRIFAYVSDMDTHPQFWGDTTLWAKINMLADRNPPLVQIDGPLQRLPQWESTVNLQSFRIKLKLVPNSSQ